MTFLLFLYFHMRLLIMLLLFMEILRKFIDKWIYQSKFSLGEDHVAYRRSDFPLIKVSVVGGRPFSSGGKPMSQKKLLSARCVL